ncbi:MAG: FAD-dependent oxidoreductase, partial [Rhodoblastus sp.]|nr:FAD-dependent oxidoreductase [Rhodoblastus sp.]
AQRIKGLNLGAAVVDGLRRSLGVKKKGEGAKSLIESFRYPRKGPGMMWEAAAKKIVDFGGRVQMGRSVEHLAYDETSKIWTVSVRRADGVLEQFAARNVVSSAPINELMASITPTPLSLLHARDLKYRDFLTVVLIGKSSVELPDNWVYIHDPSVQVGRVQNFRSWSPEMIPDGVSTCLGLEYFCFEGDGLWNADDKNLVELAKQEIDKIGLMKAADVVDASVVRQPKAYPVYDDSYARNVEVIRLELSGRFPGLHLVGRNGMHKYNNQDHAMMTGMLTALNIISGETIYNTWEVNEDAEYGEAGVSGAQEALKSERLVPRKVA